MARKREPWLLKAKQHLDGLDVRIAALDGRFYYGCGFHYAKREEAAKIRRWLNQDHLEWWQYTMAEVFLTGLTRDVIEAERSAATYDAQRSAKVIDVVR